MEKRKEEQLQAREAATLSGEPHSPWYPQRANDLFIYFPKIENNNNSSKNVDVYDLL
jgi:hypothetical protein